MEKETEEVTCVAPEETGKTWADIYAALSADLPDEAIERSDKTKTKKGYDTAGYGYQYVVNRLNEVMGLNGWSYTYTQIERVDGEIEKDGQRYPRIFVTMDVDLCLKANGDIVVRSGVGGHASGNYTDARKGAVTNALKKAAGMCGVGKKAYEGSIDEAPEDHGGRPSGYSTPTPPLQRKQCPGCGQSWQPRASFETMCRDCYHASRN